MLIFINSLVAELSLVGYGFIFLKYFFIKDHIKNFDEALIFGIIFLSFLSLILNFFLPLSETLNNLILFVGLLSCFCFLYIDRKNLLKNFIYLILIALVVSILLSQSKVYDDFGLYHLPSIRKIHDSNIGIGLVNIHFRFGHNFLLFYPMAAFKSTLLGLNGILLLPAIIFSITVFFTIKNILNKNFFIQFLSSSLLTLLLIKFYDYGNHGLDIPSFCLGLILIIYSSNYFFETKKDLNTLLKLFYLTIMLVSLKLSYILFFIFLFFNIFISNNFFKCLKVSKFYLPSIFFLIWLISNFLISSCLLYPAKSSCIKTTWSPNVENFQSHPDKVYSEISAWSKGWIDQFPNREIPKDNDFNIEKSFKDYISGNWFLTWKKKHFYKVLEYILISIVLILFNLFFFTNWKKNCDNKFKTLSIFLFFFSIINCLFWLYTAPLLRFAYLPIFLLVFSLFGIIFCIFKINFEINKKTLNLFLFIVLAVFVYRNVANDYIGKDYFFGSYPSFYSKFYKNSNPPYQSIEISNNKFLNITNGKECFYIKSPCTHFNNENYKILKYKKLLIYDLFYLNK